jgi:formylglycine-generating enzyme required for sulfatase activity
MKRKFNLAHALIAATVFGTAATQSLHAQPLTPEAERALNPQQSFRECSSGCPEMIVLPAGEFLMGGSRSEETPQHKVVFARPFAVSKFHVTIDEWAACYLHGGCPSLTDTRSGKGSTNPAFGVSWFGAQAYATWISRITGRRYRLLTEAEWEYAARAGTITEYYWGDEVGKNNANCKDCGSQWDGAGTSPVGSFKPNAFGLYDMAGNAAQWVQDCWHDDYKRAPGDGSEWYDQFCNYRGVARGGGFDSLSVLIRAATRMRWNHDAGFGVRVARTLGP